MSMKSSLLHEVTQYLSSEQCLRWVETAMIINYVGKWSKLLLNAETGLAIATENGDLTSIPAFPDLPARWNDPPDRLRLRAAGHRARLFPLQESFPNTRRVPHPATSGQNVGNWPKMAGSASVRWVELRFTSFGYDDLDISRHQSNECVFWKVGLN